jgi:hypothetical protein
LATEWTLCPERTSSRTLCRNSGGYRRCLAMNGPFSAKRKVSTKSGQHQLRNIASSTIERFDMGKSGLPGLTCRDGEPCSAQRGGPTPELLVRAARAGAGEPRVARARRR